MQIRRYAELLKAKADGDKGGQVVHLSEAGGGRGHKGVARKIADQTGLSTKTVKRALAPKTPKAVRVPDAPLDEEAAKARWIKRGMKWWNEAPTSWREDWRGLTEDTPVMDDSHSPPADGIPTFIRRSA